jgi:hypothetical protein
MGKIRDLFRVRHLQDACFGDINDLEVDAERDAGVFADVGTAPATFTLAQIPLKIFRRKICPQPNKIFRRKILGSRLRARQNVSKREEIAELFRAAPFSNSAASLILLPWQAGLPCHHFLHLSPRSSA